MFDKIYERLRKVYAIGLTVEWKREFEEKCRNISAKGHDLKDVIKCVYEYLCAEFTVYEALELAEYSLMLKKSAATKHY